MCRLRAQVSEASKDISSVGAFQVLLPVLRYFLVLVEAVISYSINFCFYSAQKTLLKTQCK